MLPDFQNFKDFQQEDFLQGKKITTAEILGKEIVVYGFTKKKSAIGKDNVCYTIQIVKDFDDEGKPIEYRVIFTSSTVLGKQCERYKNQMPFIATIIRQDKYYTFV